VRARSQGPLRSQFWLPGTLRSTDASSKATLDSGASILCAPAMERRCGASSEVEIRHDRHSLTGFRPRFMEWTFVQARSRPGDMPYIYTVLWIARTHDRKCCRVWMPEGTIFCQTVRFTRAKVGALVTSVVALRYGVPWTEMGVNSVLHV
jgi:hypothetical protein